MSTNAFALSNGAIEALIEEGYEAIAPALTRIREVERRTQERVLEAFHQVRVGSHHLHASTGYGYDDAAREALEEVFAFALQGEAAIVRPQLASGTHALWVCLDALLSSGDELVSIAGPPYDTLRQAIVGDSRQSLVARGVGYREIPLNEGRIDFSALKEATGPNTRLLFLQRSRGYAWRPALGVDSVAELVAWRDRHLPHALVMVDNCYGEFVEAEEPTARGADVMAGSLIKNPGGTLAPGGGYVVGSKELVEEIADRVTAPGLGRRVGPAYGTTRQVLQGLFVAPHFVAEALSGLTLIAYAFERLGYPVSPAWSEQRCDGVQAIACGDAERLLAFCRAVQASSPIDSNAWLEPGELPGYDDPVVMAAGAFVQGASSELSADGPLRPPFAAFVQGGTSRIHIEIALRRLLSALSGARTFS